MAAETSVKATLPQRAMHELKELVFISLYLYITLGSVILMKTAVLHTEGIPFTPWGIAIVKAVVLAKFMLLGNAMKLGERNTTSPLIWPTLERALAFLVLLISHDDHRGSRRRPVPPPVDCCLARRTFWPPAPGNDRRLHHHAAGAHSVFRLPGPQRGARRRQACADILCRAAAN